jgi:hypothetical protein
MTIDAILAIVIGVLSIAMAVLGGFVASSNRLVQWAFIIMGIASVVCVVWEARIIQQPITKADLAAFKPDLLAAFREAVNSEDTNKTPVQVAPPSSTARGIAALMTNDLLRARVEAVTQKLETDYRSFYMDDIHLEDREAMAKTSADSAKIQQQRLDMQKDFMDQHKHEMNEARRLREAMLRTLERGSEVKQETWFSHPFETQRDVDKLRQLASQLKD